MAGRQGIARKSTPRNLDLAAHVDSLQAEGRYTFDRREALSALNVSPAALKKAARRLAGKHRIASPRRGFFVIVPLEYRDAGAPPASWFIDPLMKHLDRPYYVALLSAAALHGAGHHQPQEFQVITKGFLRPLTSGRSRIRFVPKRRLERTPVVEMKTDTGSLRVSTPEATAVDLLRFLGRAGQLNTVRTVLKELAPKMTGKRLIQAAEIDGSLRSIQRLGYLLDHIGETALADGLASWLREQSPYKVPLRSDRPYRGAPFVGRWMLYLNDTVESDE